MKSKAIQNAMSAAAESKLSRRLMLTLPLAVSVMKGANLPRPVPALKIPRPGGQPPVDLAQHKGKVVAMFFLLTTCPHCKAFSKSLETVSKELSAQGFQVVGAAINDPTGRLVGDFVRETGVTFPVGFVKQETSNEFLEHPSMVTMYMPQLALIDRKGMIRFQHGGQDPFYNDQENNLRKEVKQLLAEKGGVPAKPAASGAAKGKKS